MPIKASTIPINTSIGLKKMIKFETTRAKPEYGTRWEDRVRNKLAIYLKFNKRVDSNNNVIVSVYYSIISHEFSDITDMRGQSVQFQDLEVLNLFNTGSRHQQFINQVEKILTTLSVTVDLRKCLIEMVKCSDGSITFYLLTFVQASVMADTFRRKHHFPENKGVDRKIMGCVFDYTVFLTVDFRNIDGMLDATLYLVRKNKLGRYGRTLGVRFKERIQTCRRYYQLTAARIKSIKKSRHTLTAFIHSKFSSFEVPHYE